MPIILIVKTVMFLTTNNNIKKPKFHTRHSDVTGSTNRLTSKVKRAVGELNGVVAHMFFFFITEYEST